jgi:FG-GAP-like repeat/PPIC-type PPIASE domain/ASPIC and UnbV
MLPLRRKPAYCSFLLFCLFVAGAMHASNKLELQIIVVSSRADAERIVSQLKTGSDFGELAKQHSTDGSASSGGYMGLIDPNDLRTELRAALKDLRPGQISGIVQISAGFAILKIVAAGSSPPSSPQNGPGGGPGYLESSKPNQTLAGPGNIRITPNVGGAPEAETAFWAMQKEPGFDRDFKALCTYRTESLSRMIDTLMETLSPENADRLRSVSASDMTQMHFALAELQAYRGDMLPSVEQLDATYEFAQKKAPSFAPMIGEAAAAFSLHAGEIQNDIYSSPGNRCLIPQGTVGPLRQPELVKKSIEILLGMLKSKPDDLELRWLLNLAYMTAGKYPGEVPTKYLIPPSSFNSEGPMGRFTDVATQAGLKLVSMAGGVIIDDFDGDGLLDVITSSMNFCEHMHFFHNNGDGTFTDRSEQAGFLDQLGGLNINQADYDNDGCTDILVMRGGWEFPIRRSLLHNDCHGRFVDVTRAAGLEDPLAASQTAVWADMDNDGYLDLFIGNERGPSQLFHNKGDGTFEEMGRSAHVDATAYTKAVAASDYDHDGYPDLFVSNLYGDNFLYHNNHDLTFTQVGLQAGVTKPSASFASWFFDYDNDGWPDIFVTSYYMSIDEVARSILHQPLNAETMKLYRNLGNGKFEDVSERAHLDRVRMPMGGNFGDADDDGYLDLYMGSGNPSFTSLTPYVLFRNDQGKTFQDVTAASGTGELHKGHAVAFGDLGNIGHEDIVTIVGGAVPSDSHAMRVFANPGNANDWITLHLVGVKSNRSAIGARIKVTVENEGRKPHSIYRTVGSGGSFGASPLRQHIGLGKSAKSVTVEIDWPTSKSHQVFRKVPVNHFLEIREFDQSYTTLNLKSFHLAGAGQ